MCVLTYVPVLSGAIITHNRDEHRLRPAAIPPQTYRIGDQSATYPKDPVGQGTWFALHEAGACCLLNGAWERHQRQAPYARSRGTVILDFLRLRDADLFAAQFDASGLEPFTLVLFDLLRGIISQFVWDAVRLHRADLDAALPHIWSSATLYDEAIRHSRADLFRAQAAHPQTPDQLLALHRTHVPDDPHRSFFVHLPQFIDTVSITQVVHHKGHNQMRYWSF